MTHKACLAFPHNGTAKMPFMRSVLHLMSYEASRSEDKRRLSSWMDKGSDDTAYNRNFLIYQFLEHTSDQYLWFVDPDIQFNPDYLAAMCDKLEELDGDILALPYFLPDSNITFYERKSLGVYENLKELKHDEVYDLDVVGAGMMLIHRRVLVKLQELYGIFKYPDDVPAAWFGYDEDGEIKVADNFTFCMRAQDSGFKIQGWAGFLPDHWKDQPIYPPA